MRGNWEVIRQTMESLHLPMALYDKSGIQNGRFKPCYGMLVMLYFLFHLGTCCFVGVVVHAV